MLPDAELNPATIWLALFVPLIVSVIKQSGFDDRLNRLIALGTYLVWALIVTVIAGGFTDISDFLGNFAATLTVGSVAYDKIYKAFGFDDALTDKTSIVKPPQEDAVFEDDPQA